MRIHSDTLTVENISTAVMGARAAGHGIVYLQTLERHGSRSRRQAWEVKLTGDGSHSRRRTNGGTRYTDHGRDRDFAATWDSWGHFLATLFHHDPHMTCDYYKGADDFHAKTLDKFRTL